jgi:hypothetical protein
VGKVIKRRTCPLCFAALKEKNFKSHLPHRCPRKMIWCQLDKATKAKFLDFSASLPPGDNNSKTCGVCGEVPLTGLFEARGCSFGSS